MENGVKNHDSVALHSPDKLFAPITEPLLSLAARVRSCACNNNTASILDLRVGLGGHVAATRAPMSQSHPLRVEATSCRCAHFFIFIFSTHCRCLVNLRKACAKSEWSGRPDWSLNRPGFQLSAVIDLHPSGIPHDSSSIKEKSEKWHFLFTWKEPGCYPLSHPHRCPD